MENQSSNVTKTATAGSDGAEYSIGTAAASNNNANSHKRDAPEIRTNDADSDQPPTKRAMTESSKATTPPSNNRDPPQQRKADPPETGSVPAPAVETSPASSTPSNTEHVAEPSPPAAATAAAPRQAEAPASKTPPPTANNDGSAPPAATTTPTTTAKPTESASPSKSPSPTPQTPLQPKTNGNSGKDTKKSADAAKSSKGLRHFSMMVCKKVEEKDQTTYNEVADELVKQVLEERRNENLANNNNTNDKSNKQLDEKNIRRRVYDSINVLLAMGIIAKNKKQISWKGLPSIVQHDLQLLEREQNFRKRQVHAKRQALQDLLLQQVCFRNLVSRNKKHEVETRMAEKVPLPFIVVSTKKDAIIHCNMAPDMSSVGFEYDRPFEISDDNSILMRLGMHKTTTDALKTMVPSELVNYCQEHGLLDSMLGDSDDDDDDIDADLALALAGRRHRGHYFSSIE